MRFRIFFILMGFTYCTFAFSQTRIIHQPGIIILENSRFKKTIQFSENRPGPLLISSIFLKGTNSELLSPEGKEPYFECVVNKKPLSADNKIWQYQSSELRKMGNGGEELKLIIEATKGALKGLKIVLFQQIFPRTTLMREQLILQASPGHTFHLNKKNGKLHFQFPQYNLHTQSRAQATEIRIATWANELIGFDPKSSYDERFTRSKFDDHNLANCHMFHPQINHFELKKNKLLITKGPINIVGTKKISWITAYEHASQDNLRGLLSTENLGDEVSVGDGLQGVKGTFDFSASESDLHFLGISQLQKNHSVSITVDILRGGYLENEVIDTDHPYASVWTASAFHGGNSLEKSKEIIRDYLWRCISEKSASRQPEFYYNTWGMQRYWGSRGKDLRGILTEEKIKQEIKYAAELGVDIFVLDDGWEQAMGVWTPHKKRLPNGLKPIKNELHKYGMKMGVWLSPMGIDKNSPRYKKHPEWVIVDSDKKPIKAQWNYPAFDFVSDFYNLFIEDCKKLIDQGVRFFKWDAINTFYSSLPNLHHGDSRYSEQERRERYEYLLPIYVTRAMKELTDYEPDLIIEIDLTEARRVMAGLAVLSQGKVFWMNNGASGYNDYSVYRTKSMRTIVNEFAGLIPLELFTFANYPQTQMKAQRYNVNTSLIAGHGFWGALELMKPEERARVMKNVLKSKKGLPFIGTAIPQVIGRVGGSPEVYTLVNTREAAGEVIAFSGQALNYEHKVFIDPKKLLAVLNHSYQLKNNELHFPFTFPMPDATREAFLIPNRGSDISIIASSCWLDDVQLSDSHRLRYVCGAPGKQKIRWSKKYGMPRIGKTSVIGYDIQENVNENFYLVTISVARPNTEVVVGQ